MKVVLQNNEKKNEKETYFLVKRELYMRLQSINQIPSRCLIHRLLQIGEIYLTEVC